MIKRIVALVTSILLISCLFTGCMHEFGDQGTYTHEHEFGSWEPYTPAKCTETGLERNFCSCGEELQRAVAEQGHKIEHGFCSSCKEIFEPYETLAYIIENNGKPYDSSNGYSYPKEEFKANDTKTFISYDADTEELKIIATTDTILLGITLDPSSNKQNIAMAIIVNEDTYTSIGYIHRNTFDINNSTIQDFSTTAPNYNYNNIKEIANLFTRETIKNFSKILKETEPNITMKMLGFEKVD